MIRDTYLGEFRVPLERDLNVKVEGLFGRMLQQLLLRSKDPDNEVDMDAVDKEIAVIRKVKTWQVSAKAAMNPKPMKGRTN